MSEPELGELHHGVGGLVAQGVVFNNRATVIGQWEQKGFGYTADAMREAAAAIIAACDEADAMAARMGGQPC